MKLIYTRHNAGALDEQGVLQDYDFDLAYGKDENNFTLTVPLVNHFADPLDMQWYAYIVDEDSGAEIGTEYGGIIDAIQVKTADKEVVYSGRTWHGILNSVVISPEDNTSGLTVYGDAHTVMRTILNSYGAFVGMFTVPAEDSGITVDSFTFKNYESMYVGFCRMLKDAGGKLKVVFDPSTKRIVVSAEWAVAYNQDDEWVDTEMDTDVRRIKNGVNHIVCTGSDADGTDYTIHIYADENGGMMPYTTVVDGKAKQDADYILDDHYKVISGVREICEVQKTEKISEVKNYLRLSAQPADWAEKYDNYYTLDPTKGTFAKIKAETQDVYAPLGEQPEDWTYNYGNYYTADHKPVEGLDTSTGEAVTKKPKDWDINYQNYYQRISDGTAYSYRAYSSLSVNRYEVQTMEPSDWSTNSNHYYQKKVVKTKKQNPKTKKQTETAKGDGYETVKKVKQGTTEKVPTWKKNTYYTKFTDRKPPKYIANNTYILNKSSTVPPFVRGQFFFKTKATKKLDFKPDIYYEQVIDHYAKMVEKAVETLHDNLQTRDSIDVNLDMLGDFDVGDTVRALEHTTGLEVVQPITKKIVSINKNGKTINYIVGDTSE